MSGFELSFEFFPPKTVAGAVRLREACTQLAVLRPDFVSITFGAGGSTQEGTFETVLDMMRNGFAVASHLSCIGASRDGLRTILARYQAYGIQHIVALRGDMPSGMGAIGEFSYAEQLVEFIRSEYGEWFRIDVAVYPEGHPQAKSPQEDLHSLARKVKAGAHSAITQYFYNADAYFHFVDEARRLGIEAPITPGIMPIISAARLMRFSALCGAEIPRWMTRRLESFGEDQASVCAFGTDVVTSLCLRLLEGGAPGLHFYTLNSASAALAICKRLMTAGMFPAERCI